MSADNYPSIISRQMEAILCTLYLQKCIRCFAYELAFTDILIILLTEHLLYSRPQSMEPSLPLPWQPEQVAPVM